MNKYPGLNAIVEHHIRPTSVHFSQHTPTTTTTSPKRPPRFDTSTTTLNDYDQKQQWAENNSKSSPIINHHHHHHDGYIRPLTPPKSPIQPDVTTIHLSPNHSRGHSSYQNSSESPIIYRSSTTIYTRDKHDYTDGGELRTWSVQGNNEKDRYQKPSITVHVPPYNSKTNLEENGYEYDRPRPHPYSGR